MFLQILRNILDITLLILFIFGAYTQALFQSIFSSTPIKNLEGEIILLTGSAGKIGREIGIKLINSGATLICVDIDKKENDMFVKDLKKLGLTRAFSYSIDISDRVAIEGTIAKVKHDHGQITILINAAGILPCHPFLSHNHKEITRCFEVNVFSQIWLLRQLLPDMIEKKKGHIVNVCSTLIPSRNLVPYSSANSALEGLIQNVKYELRFHPDKACVQFTTVYVGLCRSGLLSDTKVVTRFPNLFPIVEPAEVAEALINGMRRNFESVYIPKNLSFFNNLRTLLPIKVQFAVIDLIKYYVEPDS